MKLLGRDLNTNAYIVTLTEKEYFAALTRTQRTLQTKPPLYLKGVVLAALSEAGHPCYLPELMDIMGVDVGMDQITLEYLWQLVGEKKVGLTADRKWELTQKE